uniref:Uncharacterized protein n=1 Tax=Triticum urartu TaxID=4572 RepID=A0A8R7V344_TRIUA
MFSLLHLHSNASSSSIAGSSLRGGRQRVRRRRIRGSQIPPRSAGGRAQRHGTGTSHAARIRRRRGRQLGFGCSCLLPRSIRGLVFVVAAE